MQVQNISNVSFAGTKKTNTKPHREDFSPVNYDRKRNVVKAAALLGSAAGIGSIVLAMLLKAKKGGNPVNIVDLKYSEMDALKLGAASVLGGLTGGLLSDSKQNRKPKVRESIQQFGGNILFPVGLLAINNKILEKINIKMPQIKDSAKIVEKLKSFLKSDDKALNVLAKTNSAIKHIPRVAVTVASLIGGMELGNFVIKKINNKIFKEKVNHHIEVSDYTAHLDDLCLTASFISESPAIQRFTSKLLPLTFLVAGYKSGAHRKEQDHA